MAKDHQQNGEPPRANRGRFAPGNPGGPGRPCRPVEWQYLRALNEAVSLTAWKAVVKAAVAQARKGDSKAREWLALYLIGSSPPRLVDIAADEIAGMGVGIEILRALLKFIAEKRYRDEFRSADILEATRILQESLSRIGIDDEEENSNETDDDGDGDDAGRTEAGTIEQAQENLTPDDLG